ncbi:hypothetical protein GOODEAATRI_017416 [Goodea atripinnis]|uniref:Uncharacterized protein n=1 Tax=Goodea atripinnis TaxID=208336 RepID=A0ABV0PPC7_9TELE
MTAGNDTTDALCDGLEHLIVTPVLSASPQSFGAATHYMLNGTFSLAQWPCWCIGQAPAVEVGRAGKDIDLLDKEIDAVGFCLPEISPRDLPLQNLLPSEFVLDGGNILEAAVKELPQTPDWLLREGRDRLQWKGGTLLLLCPFKASDPDFVGWNHILAHPMSLPSPIRIHLLPGTDSIVTVRLSMKAWIGCCRIPEDGLSMGLALWFGRFHQHVYS